MKVGDQLVVNMAGFEVAMATIESIEDDKATIFIPGTRVVMGIARSLTDLDPEVDQAHIFDNNPVREEPPAPVRQAPVEQPKRQGIRPEDISNEGLAGMNLDSSAID